MRHIEIMDTTLRDGEQTSGCPFFSQENLLLLKCCLPRVQVDCMK